MLWIGNWCGLVMKKKGNQKLRTGFVASLTPDCWERKQRNNCICCVIHLTLGKAVDSISWVSMPLTPSILSKLCGLHFLLVKVVQSISHESKCCGINRSREYILWTPSVMNKCLILNLSLGKCCVLHQLRVNVVDSIAHEDMSCTRSLWSKYCVLNFLWVYVVDSVSHE